MCTMVQVRSRAPWLLNASVGALATLVRHQHGSPILGWLPVGWGSYSFPNQNTKSLILSVVVAFLMSGS